MPEQRIIGGMWNRVVDRPIVLAIAILAAIDWLGLILFAVLGKVPAVAAALVVCSMGAWFLVLAWYPLLPGFLRSMFCKQGERAGLFFEQMAIGLLAGCHLLWTWYLALIPFSG